ncbi:transposable element Tc1 transposase [Trichonephila clavipes]|nr:transposable element Tc1 transposase [Trichonephila clavipes]
MPAGGHQTLIVEEFEPDVFRQLIEYIHTGCVTLQARTLLGKEITPEERKIIIKLRNEGKTLRETGKIVGRTHSSIQRVINNYTSSKSVISKPRFGRPSKLTLREKRAGYHGRVACKKPHISAVNRQKRLDFTNEHVNKPPQFWEKVLFSDESKFRLFGIKERKLVWRKQGTALEKENLVPTVKHGGGGVMDLNVGDDFWFQLDNDPKHTAHNVKLWLLYNIKNQLRSPPQSPDLNPIEHLWDLLKRKIRQHHITSKVMLKRVIATEWNTISSEETSKLVQSMPKRLTEALRCLMNAADYYGLDELRKACMGFVQACINVDTVCALLASAEKYIQYKCTKSLVQKSVLLKMWKETDELKLMKMIWRRQTLKTKYWATDLQKIRISRIPKGADYICYNWINFGSPPIPLRAFCMAKGDFRDISLLGNEKISKREVVAMLSMFKLGKTRPLPGYSIFGSIRREMIFIRV